MKARIDHFDGSKFTEKVDKLRPHIKEDTFWYRCRCCGRLFILNEKDVS